MDTDYISHHIQINAPVARVWRAVTRPEELTEWLGVGGRVTREGDRLEFRWDAPGRFMAAVEREEPPHLFAWRWALMPGVAPAAGNATLVEFAVTDDAGETRLRVTERGFAALDMTEGQKGTIVNDNLAGWVSGFLALKQYLEEARESPAARDELLTLSYDSVILCRMDARWTIGELADRVAAALAGLAGEEPAPASRRVRAIPDVRAIRWYSTIGILDKPAGYRGRTALYGTRHLMQVVAIKRRQADGVPLARIQAELVGVSDDRLAELADLSPSVTSDDYVPPKRRDRAELRADADVGGPVAAPSVVDRTAVEGDLRFWGRRDPSVTVDRERSGPVVTSYGITLAPGVTVHIEADRAPEPEDILAIQKNVTPPLLRVLRDRGLQRTGVDR